MSVYFYEREIWWVAVGHNIGDEEDGKGKKFARPVLILRKFNHHLFWGIPLTTINKRGKYYASFCYGSIPVNIAILSQLRAYDSKRLLMKDGIIKEVDFAVIQLRLVQIIRDNPQK